MTLNSKVSLNRLCQKLSEQKNVEFVSYKRKFIQLLYNLV